MNTQQVRLKEFKQLVDNAFSSYEGKDLNKFYKKLSQILIRANFDIYVKGNQIYILTSTLDYKNTYYGILVCEIINSDVASLVYYMKSDSQPIKKTIKRNKELILNEAYHRMPNGFREMIDRARPYSNSEMSNAFNKRIKTIR